jgi:hypothetical protein
MIPVRDGALSDRINPNPTGLPETLNLANRERFSCQYSRRAQMKTVICEPVDRAILM